MPTSARAVALIAFALLTTAASARAQAGALSGVRGVVTDSTGAPVPHAAVTLRHQPTGQVVAITADLNGRYLVLNQAPGGPYTISAERLGFAPSPAITLRLLAGTVHQVDLTLGLAVLALPALDVRAAADSRFATERSGAATVLDRGAVLTHPTIQRDVMELVALAPMAAHSEQGFVIAGQNSRYNTFQIDGARFQDLFGLAADGVPGGTASATPIPLHAVEQFQVLVAPFDVRQTGFTGGLLNVVTRSGTNHWESMAFGHYRDRNFLGALELPGGAGARPDEFHNRVAGLVVGGPLARNRAHVFAALEIERRTAPSGGYNLGLADPVAVGLAPDSAAAMQAVLAQQYGFDAGETGQLSLDSGRENGFVRADWLLGEAHRLSARWNYVAARRDLEPNRAPTGAYEFGSQLVQHAAAAHVATLQLVSSLGKGWSNDLFVTAQRIRDRSTPASRLPIVEVAIRSDLPGVTTLRTARAGGHFEAQTNRLTQSSLEMRNAVTGSHGRHLLTLGASAELARFSSVYLPNPVGLFRFEDIAALRTNRPTYFERGIGGEGTTFSVAQLGAFVQDEFQATSHLTFRAGLRVDAPIIRDRPALNEALLASELAVNTATLPQARPLLSPRAAFNWQTGRHLRTQLRGGIGVFAGRPAYAWLANAYTQTGLTGKTLTCSGSGRAPGLTIDAPAACAGEPRPGDLQTPPIVAFARDFRYPQDLRIALGADQSLPGGLVATADLVLTRALHQVHLRDLNLIAEPVANATHDMGYSEGYGFHVRDAYGLPVLSGFVPRRRTAAFGPVIELGERASNRALAASFELSGAVRGVRLSGAYTFTRAIDAQSLVYRDAAANLGKTVDGTDPDPEAAFSDFDRPHRAVLSLTATPRRRTQLSVLFSAESGAPYTYVYAGDINGDGFPGPGTQDAFNDAVYVPVDVSDFPGSLASAAAWIQLVEKDECLRRWQGGVLSRNHCRAPATYRLDVRATQTLRARGVELRLIADVLNLLQLFGSDRGLVQRVTPLAPVIQPVGRYPDFGDPHPERAELLAGYAGGLVPRGTTGVAPLLPYATDLAASRWQAQIGLEVRPVFRPD